MFCAGLTMGAVSSNRDNRFQIVGAGSVCTVSGVVDVLNTSELMIENGGRLVAADLVEIGRGGFSTNILHVKGGSLIVSNDLEVSATTGRGNSRLIIESGGNVTNGLGLFGRQQYSTNNLALVTGPGSVWHNQNGLILSGSRSSLVISNSGLVRSDHAFLIGGTIDQVTPICIGDSIVVDGGVLSVGGDAVNEPVTVGNDGSGHQLIVTNGGRVEITGSAETTISRTSASNNLLVVSGPGSLWLSTNASGGVMNIGGDVNRQNSRLIVENGGQAFTRTLKINAGSNNDVIVRGPGSLLSCSFALTVGFVSGGDLSISNGGMVIVTNATGTALLNVLRGTNLFDGGTILVDQLRVTNGALSVFSFRSGTLRSGDTLVNNGSPFVVGDGVNVAVFQLPGGTHTFNQGLIISSNATLRGCGTVVGAVTVQPGGTVLSDCTNLVFMGTVTNHGVLRALNGSTLRAQGLLVNQGVIDVIEGTTNFTGGFINNGIVLTAADVRISEALVSGNDLLVKFPSFSGHTFQLQRRDSLATGSWADLGAAQEGTDAVLTFNDAGSLTNAPARFYRIRVVP